eukprot:2468928-Prymnesium_polylepis.1
MTRLHKNGLGRLKQTCHRVSGGLRCARFEPPGGQFRTSTPCKNQRHNVHRLSVAQVPGSRHRVRASLGPKSTLTPPICRQGLAVRCRRAAACRLSTIHPGIASGRVQSTGEVGPGAPGVESARSRAAGLGIFIVQFVS